MERAHRREWSRVLAGTTQLTRDLDLAEECTQEAYAEALRTWRRTGVPDRPGAWLTTVARNRARDVLRRQVVLRRSLPLLLVPEPTMSARITRAERKIATARIPYRVPAPDQLGERLGAVLEVVHLIFTTGHTAPAGERLVRRDLMDSAIALARLLRLLMPRESDVSALLALLLLNDARTAARTVDGRLRLLCEQDRGRWDTALIREGAALVTGALKHRPPTPYAVQAAIAAVHAESPTWAGTDWPQIVALYDVLLALRPGSPVVRLNRAAAIGFRDGPQAGLDALQPLLAEPALATYGYLSAARADFLRRLGRRPEAEAAYREAPALTGNDTERAFLTARLTELRPTDQGAAHQVTS